MSRLWAVPDQYKSLLQLSHSMITFDASLSTTKLEATEHDLGQHVAPLRRGSTPKLERIFHLGVLALPESHDVLHANQAPLLSTVPARCEISRSPSYRALPATSPVHARPVEPRTFQFDSRGCPVRRHLRPRAEKAGRISSNRLLQLAEVKRLPRAKNEIWYQRIPDPQQRPEGDQGS